MGQPIYMKIYEEIKDKIIEGEYTVGEKLLSKRAFAEQKNVSVKTVENVYDQLVAEGYVTARDRSGYYVNALDGYRKFDSSGKSGVDKTVQTKYRETIYKVNLRANKNLIDDFPANVWCRLMRETLTNDRDHLFDTVPFNGILELRKEIAENLKKYRNMEVSPDQIIIGAGTEYLYGRLIQLLNSREISYKYAIEDPGSPRIREIYESNGVDYVAVGADSLGIDMGELEASGANIVHVSPANHYPLGNITPVMRRVELLQWVNKEKGRYIIEDDYDSEYSINSRPIPPIYSIDIRKKVIYMNTFSKSVSPAVRISYMILPERLMEPYFRTMSFYSCTVPSFEQYTLAKFLGRGHLDRYVRKVNQKNKKNRKLFLEELQPLMEQEKVELWKETTGNHILLKIHSSKRDAEIKQELRKHMVLAAFLQEYCVHKREEYEGVLVVNYAGITHEQMLYFCEMLEKVI